MIRIAVVGVVAALGAVACTSSRSDSGAVAGVADAGAAMAAGGEGGNTSGHTEQGGNGGAPQGGQGGTGMDPSAKRLKLVWSLSDARQAFVVDGGVADAAISTLPGLGGVEVCVHDRPEIACATSGDDGAFELDGLPPTTDLVLTFDKKGFIPESKSIRTANTDMTVTLGAIVMSPSRSTTPHGTALDPHMGSVDFYAVEQAPSSPSGFALMNGVTGALSPRKGEGPDFFLGTKYDPRATASVGGLGFFWNLPPGEYTLTIGADGYDCSAVQFPLAGWGIPEDTAPNAVRFTVLPGYLTEEMGVLCAKQSIIVNTDGG